MYGRCKQVYYSKPIYKQTVELIHNERVKLHDSDILTHYYRCNLIK